MDSHPPPAAPRFSVPGRHPTLPPVQAAVGIPPLQASAPTPHHHLPHPGMHPAHAHAHHAPHAPPHHAPPHHLGAHLPHPVLPGIPGLPAALPHGLVPVAVGHGHGYYGGSYGPPAGGADPRVAALEAENASLRRDNELLRAKLADVDRERAKAEAPKVQSRYWTPDEHQRFLQALAEFGPKDVRAIASFVGTRNATQVRTHAQKYFLRKEREQRSALHAARKRSMSESDLVRMGARAGAGGTPPGSPLKREEGRRLPPPPTAVVERKDARMPDARQDTRMPDLPAAQAGGGARRGGSSTGLASPLSTSVISIPAMLSTTQAPNGAPASAGAQKGVAATAARPPSEAVASTAKPPLAKAGDSAGMDLLSMVATEHEMQAVRSKN